jgi:hypothetical protein
MFQTAHAGVLDKLKSAAREKTQELKKIAPKPAGSGQTQDTTGAAAPASGGGVQPAGAQTTRQDAQPAEDPDHPLRLTGQGHCRGQNSATCLDYMEVVQQCMDPLNGYRADLLAKRIEKRLEDSKLTADRRKNLEEDLSVFRDLAARKSNEEPTLGGQMRSQRYLSDIEDEDQIWVNAEYNRFNRRIMNKCEGADHMGVGHRTELITDFGPSGDEAVAEYRKTHPQRGKTPPRTAAMECMQSLSGLRFKLMADMMEKKMQSSTLSAEERSQWRADIAAVRKAAAAGGSAMPTVDDPANPMRPLTRLTTQEQLSLNDVYVKATQTAMADCQKPQG